MKTYEVKEKTTGNVVYSYSTDADMPIEWNEFPFSEYDHVEVIPDAPIQAYTGPADWLVDIGPFFDRFKTAKLDVLTSQDVLVRAIVQDVMVRKWVDLKRTDVAQGLAVIGSKIPSVTSDLQSEILAAVVQPDENLALRKMYFNDSKV